MFILRVTRNIETLVLMVWKVEVKGRRSSRRELENPASRMKKEEDERDGRPQMLRRWRVSLELFTLLQSARRTCTDS